MGSVLGVLVLVCFIMMDEVFKNKYVVFESEGEDEATDVNPFEMAEISPEIFEMVDRGDVELGNLNNLFLNCFE